MKYYNVNCGVKLQLVESKTRLIRHVTKAATLRLNDVDSSISGHGNLVAKGLTQ